MSKRFGKTKFKKILVSMLAVCLLLSGVTVLPVSAEESGTGAAEYVLDCTEDLEALAADAANEGLVKKAGANEYFELLFSEKTKIDGSNKDFSDGYTATQRFNPGGKATTEKNAIRFTTKNPATVKVHWVCGGDGREMTLLDESGTAVATTAEGTTKNALYISELKLDIAGTYCLGGDTGSNYIFRVGVTEEGGQADPVNAPTVSKVSATLSEDVVTVKITGKAGDEASKYMVEIRNGAEGEWIAAGSADGNVDQIEITVDLSDEKYGSGKWYFRAYGKGDENSDSVEAKKAISYTLELVAAEPKVTIGDEKATIQWNEIREAESYEVVVYDAEGSVAAQSDAISADAEKSFEVTGLKNGVKYFVELTTIRGAEKLTFEQVSFRPYKPVDTSNSIPGLVITSLDDMNPVVIRDEGNITVSQAASEGGFNSDGKISNATFIYLDSPVASGTDFSISADVTVIGRSLEATTGGVFLGGATAPSDNSKYVASALRGDASIRAYRIKTDGTGGGSGSENLKENVAYTLTVTRNGSSYTVKAKGDSVDFSKGYSASDLHADLNGDAVYPAILISGVTADIKNIVITVAGEEVFRSADLTGSVTPFEDNWELVDAPVLGTPIVDNENQKIGLECECEIGVTGAGQVTVDMYNEAGEKVDSQTSSAFGQSKHSFSFEPKASGIYTFKAVASRPNEETLKEGESVSAADKFVMTLGQTSIWAFNQGSGNVKLVWDAIFEATGYSVYYKEADSTGEATLAFENIAETNCIVSGLGEGEYIFIVKGVREGKEDSSSEVKKAVNDELEREWYFSAFGTGISTATNGYSGSANEGSVTVYSEGGKGKLQPASTDGLAFYYTAIPADENFTLSAKVTVDKWTYSNGQEGFGLMAADAVNKNGNNSVFWNNSYMAVASKVEYYWDDFKQEVSDSGTKIAMKLGLGSQEKIGVTAENIAELTGENATEALTKYYKSEMKTLETSCASLGKGTYNIFGNATADVAGTQSSITELVLSIQKNNTGYFVSYTDGEGNVVTNKYYDTEALEQIDKDNVYVGFFASRNARITVTDISLTTIDPAQDAPAEERPIEKVTASYSVISAANANSADYDLVFLANADGLVSITDVAGTVIAKDVAVTAGVKKSFETTIALGENTFNITFTPDADYKPGEYLALDSYETKTFTHTVNYKTYGEIGQSIYVAPGGSSSGDGSKEYPLDIYTAVKYVQAGQMIVLKGGTYSLNSTVIVDRGIDGTADKLIYMVADPTDTKRPVFDFNKACAGMRFAGDYWYCQGFDVTNSSDGQKGLEVCGSYSTFDDIHAYHNGNTGIQVSRFKGSDVYEDWPSHDLILNCTAYGNADSGYEDADGFAAKLTVGDGIVFDGCVAYNNADDGWDLFAKPETGAIGAVVIKNCVAYNNGYLEDGTNAGNGNGFKLGGSSIAGGHQLMNSVAFGNKTKGIDSNSCPDVKVYHCTSFNNGSVQNGKDNGYNVALYTNDAVNTDFLAEGVLSYRTENLQIGENIKPKGSQDTTKLYGVANYYWDAATVTSANAEDATVSDTWFESLTFTEISRNADKTINMNGFLVLTSQVPEGVGAKIGGQASAEITVLDAIETTIEVMNPDEDKVITQESETVESEQETVADESDEDAENMPSISIIMIAVAIVAVIAVVAVIVGIVISKKKKKEN